jgi:hypothetical protein
VIRNIENRHAGDVPATVEGASDGMKQSMPFPYITGRKNRFHVSKIYRKAKTFGFMSPKLGERQKHLVLCFQNLGKDKNIWFYVSKTWGKAKTFGFMFPKLGERQKQLVLCFQNLGKGKNNWFYVSKTWGETKTFGFTFPKLGERQKRLSLIIFKFKLKSS